MAPEQFISDILVGRMNAGVIVSGPDCHFGYKAAGDCAMLERLSGKYGYRYLSWIKSVMRKERSSAAPISGKCWRMEISGRRMTCWDIVILSLEKWSMEMRSGYKAVSDGESDPAGCEASSEVRRLCDAGDCGRKGLRRPYECRSETDDLRG